MREDERQRVRLRRDDVDEMNRLAVDVSCELGERIDALLLRPPVVLVLPVVDELFDEADGCAVRPVVAGRFERVAGVCEPVLEVIEVGLRHVDGEGADGGGGVGGCHNCTL